MPVEQSTAPTEVTPESSDPPRIEISPSRGKLIGVLTGIAASVGYTLANIALRESSKPDDFDWAIWVTAIKAIPATLLTWSLVFNNMYHKRVALPPARMMLLLIFTGLTMQFLGNLMFQYSLSLIGLAMTVPITFALILISGGLFSRIFLGESITVQSMYALVVLMAAVIILSLGAGEASQEILKEPTTQQLLLGIFVASVSGTGYGACGVVIRKNVRNLPVSASLVLISTTGVIAVGSLAVYRLTLAGIMATTPHELGVMLLAGVFNAGAFYSLGISYRHLNVTQVNMVNTTQIAMATLAGVLFFLEPVTPWLIIGVVMTVAGLFLMDKH